MMDENKRDEAVERAVDAVVNALVETGQDILSEFETEVERTRFGAEWDSIVFEALEEAKREYNGHNRI